MPTETLLHYDSIDDYLGPSIGRFFATGFRRVRHEVCDVAVTGVDASTPGVKARATLEYPTDWSKKKEEFDLPPHVSTVDMMVLGVQLSEVFLAHAYGLDPAARRRATLRKMTLRAGTAPQEELVDLPAVATLHTTTADSQADGGYVSVFDTNVGAMRSRYEIEHGIAGRASQQRTFATLDEALGPAPRRYFGDGFKYRRQVIEDVRADVEELTAEAFVRVESTGESEPATEGVDGAVTPSSFTPLDCFVANLQLTQILMYELDSINRRDSNTLWMLHTILTVKSRGYLDDSRARARARTSIIQKHLVPLRGGMWRNVEVLSSFGGVDMRCSFAHELPAVRA